MTNAPWPNAPVSHPLPQSLTPYRVLATDFDGTLAEEGVVRPEVVETLLRWKESGRQLVLVTGRELDELARVFDRLDIFDRVVAENGALLFTPRGPNGPVERVLAKKPPETFAAALVARGVGPISFGRVIVATWEPHEATVLDVIREQGLELDVIFNKGAVMVLPSGTNKASGLKVALEELGLDASVAIGIGDAENDHSLLGACGLGVAVFNAVDALKARAAIVLTQARGDGVRELCERILAEDATAVQSRTAAGASSDGLPHS